MIISYLHISDCSYVHIRKATLDLPQVKIEYQAKVRLPLPEEQLMTLVKFVYFCPLKMGV